MFTNPVFVESWPILVNLGLRVLMTSFTEYKMIFLRSSPVRVSMASLYLCLGILPLNMLLTTLRLWWSKHVQQSNSCVELIIERSHDWRKLGKKASTMTSRKLKRDMALDRVVSEIGFQNVQPFYQGKMINPIVSEWVWLCKLLWKVVGKQS